MFGATTYRISIIVDGKDNASGPLGGVGGALSRIRDIAGGIIGAHIFEDIARFIGNTAAAAVDATAQYQRMQVGLEGLLARELSRNSQSIDSLTGLAEGGKTIAEVYPVAQSKAKDLMDQLARIAILSPYQIKQTQETFRTAMAFDFASDEAMKFTKATLNVAAGVGADSEMLQRMEYNLAQVRLQGKVTAMDVRQLALAGFDLNAVLQYTGKQYGVVIKDHLDFNKAIKEGKITWQQFTEAYAKYADETFGGASERMSRTLFGLGSTFSDFFALTMPKILGPAAQVVTDFLNKVLDAFIKIRESGTLEAIGADIATFVTNVMGGIGAIVDFVTKLYEAITGTGELSALMGISLAPMDKFRQMLSQILPEETVNLIMSAIYTLQNAFESITEFWNTNGPALTQIVSNVFTTVSGFIMDVADRVIPWLVGEFGLITAWINENGPLITAFAQTMLEALQWIMDKVLEAWVWIQPLLQAIIDLVLNVAKIIMQVATGDWAGAWETIKSTVSGAVTDMIDVVGRFSTWLTGVVADIANKVAQALSDVGKLVGINIPNGSGMTPENVDVSPKRVGRARGGPVYEGNLYPVGENGVELFRPWTNGVIIPNNIAQPILAGGSDKTPVIVQLYPSINNGMDVEDLTYRIAERIRSAS